MATAGPAARLLPRAVLSVLVSALLVVTITAPSQAQPGDVPDPGSRPTPEGQLPMPGAPGFGTSPITTPGGTDLRGPLAADIAQKEIELQGAIQQLAAIEPQLAPAGTAADLAEREWLDTSAALTDAERILDDLVGESYRGAAALPPDLFIPELPSLHAHAPAVPVEAPIGVEAAARDYIKARDEAQAAAANLELAQNTEATLEEQAAHLEGTIDRLTGELERLRDRNAELLVQQEREREQAAQENASVSTAPVNGFKPHDKAVRAVKHALSQLGKPYVWGAEGPDAYDCSGLVLWSYTRPDVRAQLPRVAADQYWATRDKLVTRSAAVAQQGLLPGDLVFFASGYTWQTIHHVGIYVGHGQMVHAPNSREVVKVSPVWWTRFFAATRVFDATRVDDSGADNGVIPNPIPGTPPTPPGGGPTTPPPDGDPDPTTPPPTTAPPTTTAPPPTVPDLTGMTAEEAKAAIEEAGLEVEFEPVVQTDCEVGQVIGQDPAPETPTSIGSTVTVEVCEAPPETEEPQQTDPPASDPPTSDPPASETPASVEPTTTPTTASPTPA